MARHNWGHAEEAIELLACVLLGHACQCALAGADVRGLTDFRLTAIPIDFVRTPLPVPVS